MAAPCYNILILKTEVHAGLPARNTMNTAVAHNPHSFDSPYRNVLAIDDPLSAYRFFRGMVEARMGGEENAEGQFIAPTFEEAVDQECRAIEALKVALSPRAAARLEENFLFDVFKEALIARRQALIQEAMAAWNQELSAETVAEY